VPEAVGRQEQEDDDRDRDAAVEAGRLGVPTEAVLDDPRDEKARQIDDGEDDADRVGRPPDEDPVPAARAAQLEREVERGGRREADADPEHPAPQLGRDRIVEVREAEEGEIPGRDGERHRGERPAQRIAQAAAQHHGPDDGLGDRGAERDSPFVAHGSSTILGGGGRVTSNCHVSWRGRVHRNRNRRS